VRLLQDSSVTVVSWDVDGTFYNALRMSLTLWQLAMPCLLGPNGPRNRQELRRLQKFRREMNRFRARGGALPEKGGFWQGPSRARVEERWYGEAISRVGTRESVREVVAHLRYMGLRQIIVSDYDCGYKLRVLGLEGAFDEVFAGERLGFLKPSPELFKVVTEKLSLPGSRLLHIGDQASRDGVSASAAGCHAAILGRDFASFPQLLSRLTV